MKTARLFLLTVALFASQYLSAQNFRIERYTDVLGNQITEFRDCSGRVVRKECVAVDIFGDIVVTVYDEYGRRIEEVVYQKDIHGATIITIRDQYGVVVERVKYATDIFGRAVREITDRYGKSVRYKESYFYRTGRIYGDYSRYCNHRPAPHGNRREVDKPRHRGELQRPTYPPQQSGRRPDRYEGNKYDNKTHGGQRAPQYHGSKPDNRPQGGQRPPQYREDKSGGRSQGAPHSGSYSQKREQPKGQSQNNSNRKSPR